MVLDGPADGSVVLLPRVTETEFKAQAKRLPPFWSGFKHETPTLRRRRARWSTACIQHIYMYIYICVAYHSIYTELVN